MAQFVTRDEEDVPVSQDPSKQKAEIDSAITRQTPMKIGDWWCLVDCKWYRSWQAWTEAPGKHPKPQLIINLGRLLVANGGEYRLRDRLSEDEDYILLPNAAWDLLKQWYGCDHAIQRQVISSSSGGLRGVVEVYRLQLDLKSTSKENKLIQSSQLEVSRAETLAEFKAKACNELGLDMHKALMFQHVVDDDDDKEELVDEEDGSKSLEEARFSHNDVIIFRPMGSSVVVTATAAAASTTKRRAESNDDDVDDVWLDSSYGSGTSNGYGGTNGYTNGYGNSFSSLSKKQAVGGLTGLSNLGNTCFMNSSLQCLSNTVPLRQYLRTGQYEGEINEDNPLGTGGHLTRVLANLLNNMWTGEHRSISTRDFKYVIGQHAEQFTGYEQHDAHELIAYVLDGVHEDVNRVKKKPVVAAVEAAPGESDEDTARRAWESHLLRNNSKIMEVFQGQYKSIVTCPNCPKISRTFDPFMYVTLPLPGAMDKDVPVTFMPADGSRPIKYSVTVKKSARVKALRLKLSELTGVPPSRIVLADVWKHGVYELVQDDKDVSTMNSCDDYFAYEVEDVASEAGGEERPADAGNEELNSCNSSAANGGGGASGCRAVQGVQSQDEVSRQQQEDEEIAAFRTFMDPEKAIDSPLDTTDMTSLMKWIVRARKFTGRINDWLDCESHSDTLPSSLYFKSLTELLEEETADIMTDDVKSDHRNATSVVSIDENGNVDEDENAVTSASASSEERIEKVMERLLQATDVLKIVMLRLKGPITISIVQRLRVRSSNTLYSQNSYESVGAPMVLRLFPHCTTIRDLKRMVACRVERLIKVNDEAAAVESGQSTAEQLIAGGQLLLKKVRRVRYGAVKNEWSLTGPDADAEISDSDLLHHWFAPELKHMRGVAEEENILLLWEASDLFNEVAADACEQDSSTQCSSSEAARDITVPSLESCFEQFSVREQLDESEAWYCDTCKAHVPAFKEMGLWKLPPILIVHLKRFSYEGHFREKIEKLVDFPIDGLDLSRFVWNQDHPPALYDLYAVSKHYGSYGGGHYTATCRNSEDGEWYEFDDSHVSRVTNGKEGIVTSAGYVLFYRRRDDTQMEVDDDVGSD